MCLGDGWVCVVWCVCVRACVRAARKPVCTGIMHARRPADEPVGGGGDWVVGWAPLRSIILIMHMCGDTVVWLAALPQVTMLPMLSLQAQPGSLLQCIREAGAAGISGTGF